MNVLSISGNITKDLELKSTQGGKNVCSFSVAINEGKDKTLFLNCVAWEKTAELIAQYCKKGDRMTCTGKLDIRQYESNGEKKWATEMIVHQFDFPPKRETQSDTHTAAGFQKPIEAAGGFDDEQIPFMSLRSNEIAGW